MTEQQHAALPSSGGDMLTTGGQEGTPSTPAAPECSPEIPEAYRDTTLEAPETAGDCLWKYIEVWGNECLCIAVFLNA